MTFSSRIADVISAEKRAILERWRDELLRDPPETLRSLDLSEKELLDHLPMLLDDLVFTLRGQPTSSVEESGAKHGLQRRGLGYRVDECLCEMHLFRRVLLDAIDSHDELFDSTPRRDVAAMRRAVLDLLDRSIQASVRQYLHEAEGERDRAQGRLEELNQELRDSNQQKDRFLAMLAHELRNPLAPIVTSINILKLPAASAEARQRACEIIERQTQYQTRLIDDLLDINRIARGKIELKRAIFDARDAVRHAIESCQPAIAVKSQQLAIELPDDEVPVDADPTRLAQVITNLLNNASKFSPQRGSIRIALVVEDGDAVLCVRDDGTGIAPELLPRIFDLFTQADSSTHRNEGGLGVGLWLAKELIEMHGGTLEASSDGVGHGALFVLRLALATRA